MTLNITVLTPKCIYQSADYRFTDARDGSYRDDFRNQKIVMVNTFHWTASVCFAGVGQTGNLDVPTWLAARVAVITHDDPIERLIAELKAAEGWLAGIPPPYRFHSFSIGAFVRDQPLFFLISNFESVSGQRSRSASNTMSVLTLKPSRGQTITSGAISSVTHAEARHLTRMAERVRTPDLLYSELARTNGLAASRDKTVSASCFTTYLRNNGESGGRVNGLHDELFFPSFAFPDVFQGPVHELLLKQFGTGGYKLVGMSGMRSASSEEEHQTRLREKPDSPELHNNYGVFLQNKNELGGAKKEYQAAIDLDPNYAPALGNIANLLGAEGDNDGAENLYKKALAADPKHENAIFNFAKFLNRGGRTAEAIALLDQGIEEHPDVGRLQLLRAEMLLPTSPAAALEGFSLARVKGAEQRFVESGFALALHVSGAPVEECIPAYRVAIALNPDSPDLKLNLAQLLFLVGEDAEAQQRLQEALGLGLQDSTRLEAYFYQLCHTPSDAEAVFRAIKITLENGGRMSWNVDPNIELARRAHPEKSYLLERVRNIMKGESPLVELDEVFHQWP